MKQLRWLCIAVLCAISAPAGSYWQSRLQVKNAPYVDQCAEETSFYGRLVTPPTDARKLQYGNLICGLVSDGVWTLLDALYIFAAADSATALTSLISATYNAAEVGTPTFTTDRGYAGVTSISNYVSTGFNPSTASSPQFVQDSASISIWSLDTTARDGAAVGMISTQGKIELYPRYSDNNVYGDLNGAAEDTITTSLNGSGLSTLNRAASTGYVSRKNGAAGASVTRTSAAVPNDTISFFKNGADASVYANRIGAAAIGGSRTLGQETAFYNRLHTYLQVVAGVP